MFSKLRISNMKYFLRWLLARLWKNFGKVTDNIYRSGQMGKIRLPITVKKCGIEFIIALNMDGSSSKEEFEKEFCEEKDIKVLHYNWSAGSNQFPDELQNVIDILEYNEKNGIKTLIHCAGGRDRTGGAIGCWMFTSTAFKPKMGLIETFVEQCCLYKIPAEGWMKTVFKRA